MDASETLPLVALPDTEIAVFGENDENMELAGCLVSFLVDALEEMAMQGRVGRRLLTINARA
ncbi:hypothetical protein [Desulfovibrio inopinatus]|uniref:hypothetical protein n=1 Tax=Desulfovibrio inopinatus TaxID=102109 RepID=UPI000405EAA5|nr:hypothetical protein [Desulfovibrio inopinatus]